jgi:hypothetical protein
MKGICKNSPTPIKRPNLRIISIEEGEEVQPKGIHNTFKNNNRKLPKPRESYAHDAKQTLPK